MAKKTIELTEAHVKEVLEKDIILGSDSSKEKRFTYNPWLNEYRIYVNGVFLTGGQALEDLLNEYNEL